MSSWFQILDDRVVLKIRAVPRASRNQIDGLHGKRLRVMVTAAPEAGKANQKVIKLLSQILGIPKSRFAIEQGLTHRDKTITIDQSGICSHTLLELITKKFPEP